MKASNASSSTSPPPLGRASWKYVIITPAHNEERFIEKTIRSIINQTVPPAIWVVVNDGSTDRTAEIVSHYCLDHEFIKLVEVLRNDGRHFVRKAQAFQRGLAEAQGTLYDYIGNVDADISFQSDYFERVIAEFEADPQLGISGGIVFTKIGDKFLTQDETLDSVGGAVQLFRRSCLADIGGYLPLRFGGIDAAAEIMARMNGWSVRKIPEVAVYEHRTTGTAQANPLAARLKEGRRFHSLGYGVLFYCLRCIYRLKDRPVLIGSIAALIGYIESKILRRPILLPKNVVRYLRAEQRQKLRQVVRSLGMAHLGSAAASLKRNQKSKYQIL